MFRSIRVSAVALAMGIFTLPGQAATLKTLASFTGGADGAVPLDPLVTDQRRHFFGTTSLGANGYGTVFEAMPGKELKTLYTFCSQSSCQDGTSPHAGLVFDSAGNLYGTTSGGGANSSGTVFELAPGGKETVLYSFCMVIKHAYCGDGSTPLASVIMDSAGDLFGTTQLGGDNDFGTVFRLRFDSKKGAWTETILYSFCPHGGCADGQGPLAGVTLDKAGNLYGTTQLGGVHAQGTVFRVDPRRGAETALYSFCATSGCADGAEPYAGVIMDKAGNLYGTTKYGGNSACGNGGGTVYELTAKGNERVLYEFCSAGGDADGSYPEGGVTSDRAGNLFGTTTTGGGSGSGVIFELTGAAEKILYSFCSSAGCAEFPEAGVVLDKSGNLFGTATAGGKNGYGAVFELTD